MQVGVLDMDWIQTCVTNLVTSVRFQILNKMSLIFVTYSVYLSVESWGSRKYKLYIMFIDTVSILRNIDIGIDKYTSLV